MDAVEYFKAYARMCDSFDSKNNITGKPCVGCPLDDIGRGCHMNDLTNNAEECVAAVEKWAKEHPVKTRQSKFLKIFPSAQIEDETVSICPAKLNVAPHATNMGRTCIYVHDCAACRKCKRDFWLTEISEREADKMHRKQLRGAGIVGTLQGTKKPIKLGVIILLNAWKHL